MPPSDRDHPLLAAYVELEAMKARATPFDVRTADTLQVAEAGQRWIEEMLATYSLDESVVICERVEAATVPNLQRMVLHKRLGAAGAIKAAIGAGFYNGLGIGLIARRGEG